jgi:hypothetical protein
MSIAYTLRCNEAELKKYLPQASTILELIQNLMSQIFFPTHFMQIYKYRICHRFIFMH